VVANISATATSVAPAHLLRISQIGRVLPRFALKKRRFLVFKDFVNKTFTVRVSAKCTVTECPSQRRGSTVI